MAPQTLTKVKHTSKIEAATQGWWTKLRNHSNYLQNFDWSRFLWKDTNTEETTHILASNANNNVQGPAQLWVTGTIDRAYLVFAEYANLQIWTIELEVDQTHKTALESGLRQLGILKLSTWTARMLLGIATAFENVDFQVKAMAMDDESDEEDEIIEAKSSIVDTLRSECAKLVQL